MKAPYRILPPVCLALLAGTAQAQEDDAVHYSQLSMLAEPTQPQPASVPPVRPCHREDGFDGSWVRLGYEHSFLFEERHSFVTEDEWWMLQEEMEVTAEELNRRLYAIGPRAIPLRYKLELSEDGESWTVLEGEEPVRPGEVVVFGEHRSRQSIIDLDVEIAQASLIADPIMADIVTGATLALELQPIGSDSYIAQFVARHSREGKREEINLGKDTAMSGAQRNTLHFEETGMVARIKAGEPNSMSFPGYNGRQFRLTLEVESAPQKQSDPQLLYLPSLVQPAVGFRGPRALGVNSLWEDNDWEESLPEPRAPELDLLFEHLEQSQEDFEWPTATEGGLLFMQADERFNTRRALLDAAEAATRSASLEVEVVVIDPNEEAPYRLAMLEAPIVVGTPAGFGAGSLREAVTEWDAEVAQGSRVPDPVFSLVESGIVGTLRLLPATKGQAHEIELDLQIADFDGLHRHEVRLGRAIESRESKDGTIPFQHQDLVIVEEPKMSGMHIQGRYPLEPGDDGATLRIVRSSNALYGEGSRVELRVRVR